MIRKQAGISIVEVMTVIAVIAILCAIAVPGYIGWLPTYRLSTAARDVLSDLEFAPLGGVWDEVASDTGNCMGRKCPTHKQCFYFAARLRAYQLAPA